MFYAIENKKIKEISSGEFTSDAITVGYLSMEQFLEEKDTLKFDDALNEKIKSDENFSRTKIEVYDECSYGVVNVVHLEDITQEYDRFIFVIRKKQFFIIKLSDDDDSTMTAFINAVGKFKQNATLEKVIYGIFETLLSGGNEMLEECENLILQMEHSVINGKVDMALNNEIFDLRNRLSAVKNYYLQLVDLGEELQENENDIFEEEDLRFFKIFTDKAEKLSNNTQYLSESLIHLRETLDAFMNYNMNNTMKVLTVVSVIFLPLTLIVGWYGMNFKYMPELEAQFAYPLVALLCVLIVIICLIYFKKKKFF